MTDSAISSGSMEWDVIVIGGGHAGCEAAHASARIGCRTAMVTLNPSRIGFMSCNPAIGGLAKGQLVKEIDALGGVMGRITDLTTIQYRRLNASKGPAVRSSRAQCDKALYAQRMQEYLQTVPNLSIISGEVSDLILEGSKICGVRLHDGCELKAPAVVITSGTFLQAVMYTGFEKTAGGRAGDSAAGSLSGSLAKIGFKLGRLKTGTPPRLHRQSIDFSRLEAQAGDLIPIPFSFYHKPNPFPLLPQVNCYVTYTNEVTHGIIEKNFNQSPMFTGLIQGVGPRYCPSIEDKVKRFRDKDRHQIFLEPEGLNTDEVYVNGISTSLPREIQDEFVHSIVGLEKAEFIRYGYAVEYDCIDPRQLRSTLESKDCEGLFFAGQVNGTSGYEEAGAQGIIAGINAALAALGRGQYTVSRDQGYIGVLIDDLITKGADEPYRMFTSRAEYRLLLREDNADLRLSESGRRVGLLGDQEYSAFLGRKEGIDHWRDQLKQHFFMPIDSVNQWFASRGLSLLKDRVSAESLLRRPEISWKELCDLGFPGEAVDEGVKEQVEVQTKYEGYIKRDMDLMEGFRKNENLRIPLNIDYDVISGLSNEIRGRLRLARPETIGQASRLTGVTPAAVANLLIYLKMQENQRKSRVEV